MLQLHSEFETKEENIQCYFRLLIQYIRTVLVSFILRMDKIDAQVDLVLQQKKAHKGYSVK